MTHDNGSEQCSSSNGNHTCHVHLAEITKRNTAINNMEKDIEQNSEHIASLLTFMNKIKGGLQWGSVLFVLVITGSYIYTYNHKQETLVRCAGVKTEVSNLKSANEDLKIKVSVAEERYLHVSQQMTAVTSQVNTQLAAMNHQLNQLITALVKNDIVPYPESGNYIPPVHPHPPTHPPGGPIAQYEYNLAQVNEE